jgi:Cell cycle protein
VAGLAVIFFAGLKWKWIAPPVLLGLIAVVLLVVFEPELCADGVSWPLLKDYQQQRICTLLDPTRDPLGKGFHIIQGMIAIGSGGVWGKGFMQGTQTHLEFIPERTTDFIFAAFSEEFGLAGVLVLIAAFAFLILRGLTIAMEAPTLFSRLLAGAITMIFFTYAFVNMGMVSGILPVGWITTPIFTQRRAPFLVTPNTATAISRATPSTYSGTAKRIRRCGGICATKKRQAPAISMLRPCNSNWLPWSCPDEYIVNMPAQARIRTANANRPSNPWKRRLIRENKERLSKVTAMGGLFCVSCPFIPSPTCFTCTASARRRNRPRRA